MSPAEIARTLECNGFCLVPQLFSITTTDQLIQGLEAGEGARLQRAGDTYGARNLFGIWAVKEAARSAALRQLLNGIMGDEPNAVRAIYFDKTPKANWPVAWHQDLSLALSTCCDLPGWTNWTVKRGIPHVQAPQSILERMVTVRIHLDDCPAENGALRVIAGSHGRGILDGEQTRSLASSQSVVTIPSARGDALFLKPLILHTSPPAQNPSHRRVLHLEFAPAKLLPEQLTWAEAV